MTADADYIVVGAGAAGCLLANRLSADPGCRVVLLEAGDRDWNPLIRVPMVAGLLYFMPSLNWGYATRAQPGLAGRELVWPRGRVLGGSTAINGMMYVRGQPADYDDWRDRGLPGWGYEDVLPLFRSFERNLTHRDARYHGHSGELVTARASGDHPVYAAWLAAAEQAGLARNDDFNGPRQEGVGPYDFNVDRGRRVSAASAFLAPVRGRANLRVVTGAHVRRLVFEGRRCTGVELSQGGTVRALTAAREVVLCAGAVNSPALLQLSGVGDPALLQPLGLPVVLARPAVGANLQDHLGVYVQHRCRRPVTLYSLMRPDRALVAGARALLFGSGPAARVPLEVGGFARTRSDLDRPDVHITAVPGLSLATTQRGQLEHGFLTNVYQLRPDSRGCVRIVSPDPHAKPAIDPNYLSAEADLRCLRDGVRLVRRIHAQPALDDLRGPELAPGPDVVADAEIDGWIRATANTIFHPVGTCRMGSDAEAVLDAELKVRGVEGLRVADASVMPTITSGNTSVPTMMIAAKAAELITGRRRVDAAA
jgi:choline dehydrogenase